MGFISRRPPAPLSDRVELLWDWDMPPMAHRFDRILPSARVQLVVNLLEDETRVYDEAFACTRAPGASLDGPSARTCIIDTAEQVRVVGAVLRPGTGALLLGDRMDLLLDAHTGIDALVPAQARALRTRLLEAGDAVRRLAVLQAWLTERMGTGTPHALVMHALRRIDAAPSLQRIEAVARDCGISTRRLHMLFREHVGMPPKRYARLRRFHDVVARTHGRRDIEWARVAADCGFHDQAHLNHEFRAFSGMSPGAWLRAHGDALLHVPLG